MNVAVTSGPVITTIGVGAVFVALTLLITVIVATSHLIGRRGNDRDRKNQHQVAKAAGGTKNPLTPTRPDRAYLLRIAVAAYGLHRRNSVTVRAPEPVSQWGIASRVAQRERFPGKARETV